MEKQMLLINGERLKQTILQFAEFGKTKAGGVTRLSLSEEDLQARNYFLSICKELGMNVFWDDMANMYAVLQGTDSTKPPIVIGSHLDSVEKGGKFDGALGVIAGIEIVRTLIENNITPKIPIIIVNFTNEEGARFEPSLMASGVLSGKFDKEKMLQSTDKHGITFGQALQESGFAGSVENRLKEAKAFFEMHIEQGPVLESEKKTIGIVECVVGMVCYEVEVTGKSNHAGTTPMYLRKDALFTANELIHFVRDHLGDLDEELVFTIGRMDVSPNIHTVIPNKVVFTIESRHKSPAMIQKVEQVIQELPKFGGACKVTVKKLWDRETVLFEEDLVQSLEESAKELGYSYKRMQSGAGHDAQFIASYIPTAMLFVPSVNGISHAEDEFTSFEDCEKGVNVLLQTVLKYIQ